MKSSEKLHTIIARGRNHCFDVCNRLTFEELFSYPEIGRVVGTTVELADEGTVLFEVLGGAFEGVQRQFVLIISIAVVRSSHIGSAIAEDDVGPNPLHLAANGGLALLRGDVSDERDDVAAQTADGQNVHRQHHRLGWQASGTDLAPASWSGAQVDHGAGVLQQRELAVDLRQLEGGTGPVALLFGHCVREGRRYKSGENT